MLLEARRDLNSHKGPSPSPNDLMKGQILDDLQVRGVVRTLVTGLNGTSDK